MPALSTAEVRRLYDEFVQGQFSARERRAWAEDKAALFGVSAQSILRRMAALQEEEIILRRIADHTEYQRIAALVGATTAKALATLAKQLKARTTKWDKENNRFDLTDNAARIAAAAQILKVHGAYAPDKSQVTIKDERDPANMTEEQLQEELEKLRGAK